MRPEPSSAKELIELIHRTLESSTVLAPPGSEAAQFREFATKWQTLLNSKAVLASLPRFSGRKKPPHPKELESALLMQMIEDMDGFISAFVWKRLASNYPSI